VPGSNPRRWCLLVLTLPARPAYLRARIRGLLAESGAAPIRKAVYALPFSETALERMTAIANEVESGGGSAIVCDAAFPDGKVERAIESACRSEREHRLREWMADASSTLRRAKPGRRVKSVRSSRPAGPATERVLAPLRRRLGLLRQADPDGSPLPPPAAALLAQLEGGSRSESADRSTLAGRVWVTRRGLHVDRLACAWVVRRFIDPAARFRFVADPAVPRRPGEIGFDMPGAEISHEGGACSVETLIRRAGLEDPAVKRIAEIVHDIDLKDGRFGHPETTGFEQMLLGTIAAAPRDEERLERGIPLFDTLRFALSTGEALPAASPRIPSVRFPAPPSRRKK